MRAVQPAGGRRADLGNRYFRSAWEANYARYLRFLEQDGHIEGWDYEPIEFEFPVKRGQCKTYKPDFRVIERDGRIVYHEVKGWMDPQSQTKLKRMARYYPNVKILLIDRDYYRDIARKLAPLIEGWE